MVYSVGGMANEGHIRLTTVSYLTFPKEKDGGWIDKSI